ncbi:MAG: Cthe_2314 family HEPN domain-containing protein [Candidatus Magasanikbacteria bacterium]
MAKKSNCIHIQDIPKKYFPRNTKAKECLKEMIRMMNTLVYTNKQVQHGAQICIFNIKSIHTRNGFVPHPPDVFDALVNFVYHYENYCFRAYCFREKMLLFLNEILPLNYNGNDINIKNVINHPFIKQAKLLSTIKKFETNKNLKKIIEERNTLTHKLYYNINFDHYLRPQNRPIKKSKKEFKEWCEDWKNEISNRAELTNIFTHAIFSINHDMAPKIIKFRDFFKSFKNTGKK